MAGARSCEEGEKSVETVETGRLRYLLDRVWALDGRNNGLFGPVLQLQASSWAF